MPEIPQDTLKQEREILQAIGWRILYDEQDPGVGRLLRPSGHLEARQFGPRDVVWEHAPSLSDPGTFWPMFEVWLKSERFDAEVDICSKGTRLPLHFYFVSIHPCGNTEKRYEANGSSGPEALIKAWHQALVALGKIKA